MAQRMNLMGRTQILKGDKTSHGGVVLEGNPLNTWHGIPIARKGDRVYCPLCSPHSFVIAEGTDTALDTAAALPMAGEGHRTSCGAVLIAESAHANALGAAIAKTGGTPADHGLMFDRFFHVQDDKSGKGKSGIPYRIALPDGDEIKGFTDENGNTQTIYSTIAITATLEIPYHGDNYSTTDAAHGSDTCRR